MRTINRDRRSIVVARNKLKTGLSKIFKSQLKTIIAHIDSIRKDDSLKGLDGLKWTGWKEFNDLFGKSLAGVATDGVRSAYGQLDLDSNDGLNVANVKAIEWAKEHSANLVGKSYDEDGNLVDNPNDAYSIDSATREFLRADITRAMEEGLSNDELADLLAENYGFSDLRAEMIARTETAFADCAGNDILYKESGVVSMKRWIVGADCCDECDQIDKDPVPLDDNFSNGEAYPPAHPNCRCDFLPVLDGEE